MLIHLTLRYGLFIVLLLTQAAAWRFGSIWSGTSMSALLLIFTAFFANKLPDCWRQQQILCFFSAAVISGIGSIDVLWPCELSCSKGEEFAALFELPVLWLAAGSYLLAMLLHCSKRPGLALLQQCSTWMLFGSSLFYLGLSAYMGIICPLCLAIHSCILTAGICAWNARHAITQLIFCIILGSTGIAGSYAAAYYWAQNYGPSGPILITPHGADTNNNDPLNGFFNPQGTAPSTQADNVVIEDINRGRTLGDPTAPYQVSLFIRLGCNHCASWVPQIYEDSKILCKEYPVSIRFHYLINRMSAKSIQRHHLALAAALDNKFFLAQSALLGNEAEIMGFTENLAAFGLDTDALEKKAQLHKSSLEHIIKNDKKLLDSSSFSARASPIIGLIHNGEYIAQWDGKDNWGVIKTALQERIPKHGED